MKINEKLVALRKEKGLSQLDLAEMMNVSRQAISRWEVGAAIPSIDNLKYLGSLYNVSLEYLLNEEMENPPLQEVNGGSRNNQRATRKLNKSKLIIGYGIILCIVIFIFSLLGGNSSFTQNYNFQRMESDREWEEVDSDEFEMRWD